MPFFSIPPSISAAFKPNVNISVDEAMISFHVRLSFKQHIKNKPNPWGIKVWCMCIYWRFDIYTGKVEAPMPHGVGHYVVSFLCEPYLDKFPHLFYDNFFSSVQLAKDLLERSTYSCSTFRDNRRG